MPGAIRSRLSSIAALYLERVVSWMAKGELDSSIAINDMCVRSERQPCVISCRRQLITDAESLRKRKLLVIGSGFKIGSQVLLNGEPQQAGNSIFSPRPRNDLVEFSFEWPWRRKHKER